LQEGKLSGSDKRRLAKGEVHRDRYPNIKLAIAREPMRRLLAVLGILLLATPLCIAAPGSLLAHRNGSETSTALTIPAETLVKARLISGMHTLVSHVNDPVSAEMTEPVIIDGHIALPAGTLFDGHITSIRRPGWMRRNGEIAFRFDHVTLPEGEEVPVSAIITRLDDSKGLIGELDSEGHVQGRRRGSWKTFLTGAVGIGGLTAAKLLVASSTALNVAAPAGAAAFVSYELFLRRGSNVNVPPMTKCRIRLLGSLRIPGVA
jgi:hypothetical protein